MIIIFEGPDRTGKTEMAKELANRFHIPYFKMTTEYENWQKGKFKEALEFDQPYLLEFLRQTKTSVVIDRAYPSEFVYSRVFDRQSNNDLLWKIDEGFANLGTQIIVSRRISYSESEKDDLIPDEKFPLIDKVYQDFMMRTKCNVADIFVDYFNNDLSEEMNYLAPVIQERNRNKYVGMKTFFETKHG